MNWIPCVISTILIWVNSFSCIGQNNDLLFHHLRVQDGLSQATNWFTYKDSRGFIWISSLSGLNRFDGTHVKLFTPDISDPSSILGENIQSNFYEDRDSNIWFTTLEAINKYNWDQDCFDHYQLTDSKGNAKTGYYIFYLDAFQNLWFLLDGTFLYTFNITSGQFTLREEVPINANRCRVVVNPAGQVTKILFRGTTWPDIIVMEIHSDQTLGIQSHLPETPGEIIRSIDGSVIDGDTVVWILSTTHLIRHSWLTDEEKLIPVSGGQDVIRLNDSLLLIATAGHGLFHFNSRTWRLTTNQIKIPDQPASLQSNNIRYTTKDNDDNTWVSTDGLGVSYSNLHKKKFNTAVLDDLNQKDAQITPVRIFQEGPGSIMCFTKQDGALQINYTENSFVTEPVDAINMHIHSDITNVVKDHNGNYWICTWTDLYIYVTDQTKMVRVNDTISTVMSTQLLPDGSVLFTTTTNGLYRGKAGPDGQFSFSRILESEVDGFPVFLDQQGRIWLNESFLGFAILDSATYDSIAYVPVNGLCYQMGFSPDGNTIWIASNIGLFEIDASRLEIRKVHSDKTGFPATGISSMIMDDNGILWLGHYKGIISFDTKTGKTRSFSQPDGLPSLEFTSAVCKLSTGEFWFGSMGGLTRFYPDRIKDIQVRAIPQITELRINDKPTTSILKCETTGATNITEIKKLTFDYKHNTLSFLVNALEYSAPEYNKVLYTMEGLDEGFVTGSNGSLVRYPNMRHGNYRFILYATNSDGVQNPEPRILEISIQPPFYKTWWFMLSVALICISIVAYIVYLRFSKALELHKVRLKLYENLHDDVGSRLTAIVLSAEDLERNENIHHPKLHAISQIARSIVGNMRRLVWAIDPENDSMNSLMQKITHDKSTILDDAIHFNIEMASGIRNSIVPGEVRYQISSICNEAFTNITKYAKAKNVFVRITKENGSLILLIKDDGIGFTPNEKTKNVLTGSGYGLANMNRRASRVGGTFALNSTPGEGTTIEAKFPLS